MKLHRQHLLRAIDRAQKADYWRTDDVEVCRDYARFALCDLAKSLGVYPHGLEAIRAIVKKAEEQAGEELPREASCEQRTAVKVGRNWVIVAAKERVA